MNSYVNLYLEHEDYVSRKATHYLFIYEELLSKYLKNDKPLNILEIGVQNGGSLQIWEKFLPKGSQIYGLDINPDCEKLKFKDNIHLFIGDASKSTFWENNMQDITFDIILDDASHFSDDIINVFNILFLKKLKLGGTYIIEDLSTNYRTFKGRKASLRKKGTAIEYLKNMVDCLNINYAEKPLFFSKNEYEKLKELNKQIKRISFYDAICAIEKYNAPIDDLFTGCYTGKIAQVFELGAESRMGNIENCIEKIDSLRQCF